MKKGEIIFFVAVSAMILLAAYFFYAGYMGLFSEKYQTNDVTEGKKNLAAETPEIPTVVVVKNITIPLDKPVILLKVVGVDAKTVKFAWKIFNFPPAENGDYWFYMEKSIDGEKWRRDSLYNPIPANILDAFSRTDSSVIDDKAIREKDIEAYNASYRIKAVIGPEYAEQGDVFWEKEVVVSNVIDIPEWNPPRMHIEIPSSTVNYGPAFSGGDEIYYAWNKLPENITENQVLYFSLTIRGKEYKGKGIIKYWPDYTLRWSESEKKPVKIGMYVVSVEYPFSEELRDNNFRHEVLRKDDSAEKIKIST